MSKYFLRLKLFLRNFFGFSLKETNGFLILLVLMVFIIFLPLAVDKFWPPAPDTSLKDQQTLDSLLAVIETNTVEATPKYTSTKNEKTIAGHTEITTEKPVYFPFNPNTATAADFIKLGLPTYLAKRIEKFREKGGKFYIKTDLKKIYGFPEEVYTQWEPYIELPDNRAKETEKRPEWAEKPATKPLLTQKQDINLADSAQFEKVYGIGAKLASRIVKYRKKLGGFISMQQLGEVYGLDSTVKAEVFRKFEISPGFEPQKIAINKIVDAETMKSHPYFGYQNAKLIQAYRRAHGNIHVAEQLAEIKVLTTADIEKMKPYIDFSE